MIEHWPNQIYGRKLFTSLIGYSPPWREAKAVSQDRSLQVGTKTRRMKEYWLLVCIQSDFQLRFLYNLGMPDQRSHHPSWSKPFFLHDLLMKNVLLLIYQSRMLSNRPIWLKEFLNRGSLFLSVSSLYYLFKLTHTKGLCLLGKCNWK